MKNKIALITGGAGFIGSHMADLLVKNNYEVRIIDDFSGGHEKNIVQHSNNYKVKVKNKDILKIKEGDKFFKDVDCVYHFAGKGDIVPSIEAPISYMNTNVIGTIKVLENCRFSNIKKFVYAASSSCYGLAKTPTKETHKIQPLYPYALSKYMGEQNVLHWSKVYNLPVISIRIFNAYGTRVKTTGAYGAVFGVFFKQKLANKPFTIVGNGKQKRDFIYVTDVAEAFYKCGVSDVKNEIFNLGAGNPQTISKLVNLIDNNNNKIFLPNRPGEPEITWADISKISKMIDWKPKIKFEKGVRTMLKDIKSWKDAPLWEKESIKKATKTWFKYMSK